MKAPRAWFWRRDQLTYPHRLIDFGSDEHGRSTVGVRVPGGMWWIAWRQCRHRNTWFDRTICPDPCDSMHDVCIDCGVVVGHCALDHE